MRGFLMWIMSCLTCAGFLLAGCTSPRFEGKTARPEPRTSPDGLPPSQRPYTINGETYYPLPDHAGYVETGKASWYGGKFHGRPTASGEIYDMHRLSAAHKVLPLGTYVLVENLVNQRSIVLRVNDRGPFVKGRIIDLSYAAACEIDMVGVGVTDVRVTALARELGRDDSATGIDRPVLDIRDFGRGIFTVQVGAFRSRENAERLADRLKLSFDGVEVTSTEDPEAGRLYRVRVSKAPSLAEARVIEQRLESLGFEGAFIVSL